MLPRGRFLSSHDLVQLSMSISVAESLNEFQSKIKSCFFIRGKGSDMCCPLSSFLCVRLLKVAVHWLETSCKFLGGVCVCSARIGRIADNELICVFRACNL